MSMAGHLEEREARRAAAAGLAERDASTREWMQQDRPAAARLLKFDRWVRGRLESTIDWSWAGTGKARRIEQCRVELEGLVLELWRRGWMLDGTRLAARIDAALADIAKAQRAGRVREFWPFYKAVVARFVGVHAEEIKDEAMSAGVAVADVFAMLKKKAPALPELLAQRRGEIREAQAEARRKESRAKAAASEPQLF